MNFLLLICRKNSRGIAFFLLCVISRIISSIYYYEDIDSLRFALSAHHFSIRELRPHFPGYPIYCFLLKGFYYATKSVGVSASIIGGTSIFLIAQYTSKIASIFYLQRNYLIKTLIFINPLLYMMSNRIMPDLFGLAVSIISLYYFIICTKFYKPIAAFIAIIMFCLLGGIRVSYMPLFIIYIPLVMFRYRVYFWRLTGTGLVAISLYLIPFILTDELGTILEVGLRHSKGHFTEWGGTFISDNSPYMVRLVSMFKSIWADSFGGYWLDRGMISLMTSITFLLILFRLRVLIKEQVSKTFILALGSFLCYIIWAFLYQNVVYKPRHILPLIPPIVILLSAAYSQRTELASSIRLPVLIVLISTTLLTTIRQIKDHKKPSAISQIKNYLYDKDKKTFTLSCDVLLFNYLIKHNGFSELDYTTDLKNLYLSKKLEKKVISTYPLPVELFGLPNDTALFVHNKYVNRLWHERTLYLY